MGKVVAVVATIALAVAVAAFAPALGTAFLTAVGTQAATTLATAAATGLAASVMSLAGGLLIQQIGSNPARLPDGRHCPSWTPTQARSAIRVQENWRWKDIPQPAPAPLPIGPVQINPFRTPLLALVIWGATWLYGTRFWLVLNAGDCMEPMLPKGHWVLIDNARAAQPGDAISFMTDDLFINWTEDLSLAERLRSCGMIKQYLGLADDGQVMVFRSMNDPVTGHTGIARLQYLHVVRSTHATWFAAIGALIKAACRG
ncbi:hypothetical protein [Blastomonas sp. SL216]|uniref:hypothetical protein n=1 Tax=Blastomonas sp. SL216 TaxID=2995169 RepID=UPI002376EA95|nr:hypothetical protein OU999_05490 [Blastomonas sp. SL216]